ncbi:MAG: superinfection immunity protein [Caulobacteraceae bacterium]
MPAVADAPARAYGAAIRVEGESMKTCLILLALLWAPTAALAQNTDTQSDSHVCYHGQPNDPRTDAACARIQAATAAPAESQSAMAPPANQTATTAPATPTPVPTAALPAAAPPPTDVGEAPVASATQNAEEDANANAEQGTADENVSVHSSLFAGLGVLVIVLFAAIAIVYFIPTMVALARRKRNALAIFVLNLFLGWSFIGWVAALVWSLASEPV